MAKKFLNKLTSGKHEIPYGKITQFTEESDNSCKVYFLDEEGNTDTVMLNEDEALYFKADYQYWLKEQKHVFKFAEFADVINFYKVETITIEITDDVSIDHSSDSLIDDEFQNLLIEFEDKEIGNDGVYEYSSEEITKEEANEIIARFRKFLSELRLAERETKNFEVRHKVTERDLDNWNREIAEKLSQIKKHEAEIESYKNLIERPKGAIKALGEEIDELIDKKNLEYDSRYKDCPAEYNFRDGVVIYRDPDTNEIISEEPIPMDKRQLRFFQGNITGPGLDEEIEGQRGTVRRC
jgi:hypothetical protein